MTNRRLRRTTFRSKRVNKRVWVPHSVSIANPGTSVVESELDLETVLGADSRDSTYMGSLISGDVVNGVNETRYHLALLVGNSGLDADDMPPPASVDGDFVWWTHMHLPGNSRQTYGGGIDRGVASTRARRRLSENAHSIYLIVQETAGGLATVTMSFRHLFLVP